MTEKLEAIGGSMYSGKTEELLRRLSRAEIAGERVQVFKPATDDRWGEVGFVVSHSGARWEAVVVSRSTEMLEKIDEETTMVGIDEAQFFDEDIVEVVLELLDRNIKVIIAGLLTDFRGEPFGYWGSLFILADEPIGLTAICTEPNEERGVCGRQASKTQRLINGEPANWNDPVVLVGDQDEGYEARCYKHHRVKGKKK